MKKPEPEEFEDSSGSFILCFVVTIQDALSQ